MWNENENENEKDKYYDMEKKLEEMEKELKELRARHMKLEKMFNNMLNHLGEMGKAQVIVKIGKN